MLQWVTLGDQQQQPAPMQLVLLCTEPVRDLLMCCLLILVCLPYPACLILLYPPVCAAGSPEPCAAASAAQERAQHELRAAALCDRCRSKCDHLVRLDCPGPVLSSRPLMPIKIYFRSHSASSPESEPHWPRPASA